ncbi:Uncharacterised protein [Vibrio cholerae]|nr:Uncharacterised protein [Vibrio cholerae]
MAITFLLEAAAVLATFVHPNHIVSAYAHEDSLTCRLPATPSSLVINSKGKLIIASANMKITNKQVE